jgi:hypothetical protein
VADFQRSDIRVSDTEREDALEKLGEHMSAGRLDIDEYGERSAKVTTAKTRGELLDLFGDLPEPRPAFGRPAPPVAAGPRTPSIGHRVAPVVVPIVAISLAFMLVIVTKVPFFFLLPFLFIGIAGSHRRRAFDQHGHEEYRRAMREYRGAMREHHRRMRRRWSDEGY